MLTYFQAIILGLFQGLTELFPVSSLGHSIVLPALLGWHVDEGNDFFLIFLVATHFATSLALIVFFFEDWLSIIQGFFRPLKKGVGAVVESNRDDVNGQADVNYTRLAWLLIVGTIPAGLIGLIFQSKIQMLFASPRLTALFLIGNGLMLWGVDRIHRHGKIKEEKNRNVEINTSQSSGGKNLATLTWGQSLKVGLAQCLALIPGFSRTGATIGGGRLVGLSYEAAAYFAFLLATPIIFAAATLKLPALGHYVAHGGFAVIGPLLAGSLASFIAAYFSARFLVRYFKTKNLIPFAVYCVVFGVFASLVFFIPH